MRQLQLDLDDRPQVRYIYPNDELTGVIGRVVEVRGRIAFVYFKGVGTLMCKLTNLEMIGGAERVSDRNTNEGR